MASPIAAEFAASADEHEIALAEAQLFNLDAPLAPTPGPSQTRAKHLLHFPALLRDWGHNPNPLLERQQIEPGRLGRLDGFIDCDALINLMEESSEQLHNPLFGVQLAERQSTHVLGVLEPLCRAAPDLRTAIQMLIDYAPVIHSPRCLLEMIEDTSLVELRCDGRAPEPNHKQISYAALQTMLMLMRDLAGPGFTPQSVSVAYDRRGRDTAALETALGCKVLSGQSHTSIIFPKAMLGIPLASGNRLTFNLLRGYLERLRTGQQRTFLLRVEDSIRVTLEHGGTLAKCAGALGISARSLQIALDRYGISFSDLLAKQRLEMAKRYLRMHHLSLDGVAQMLGYADQTSFGRAFRRWTGMTPGAFRGATQASPGPGDQSPQIAATRPRAET